MKQFPNKMTVVVRERKQVNTIEYFCKVLKRLAQGQSTDDDFISVPVKKIATKCLQTISSAEIFPGRSMKYRVSKVIKLIDDSGTNVKDTIVDELGDDFWTTICNVYL
jgi:hypothetical protein